MIGGLRRSETLRYRQSVVNRAGLWLPLLRRLSAAAPTWGVWKSPESAFAGEGDIDAVGAVVDRDAVVRECRVWADTQQLGAVVVCTHVPDLLVVATCEGPGIPRLLQLDVYSRRFFRGAPLDVRGLGPMMVFDERGFRRLRPGAEGLLLLLARGIAYAGRPSPAADLERIAELLRSDPTGVKQASEVLGPQGRHALAGARALAADDWAQRELVALEARSALRVLRDPRELARCASRDLHRLKKCLLIRTLEQGRRIPGDIGAWLEAVGKSHPVYGAGASSSRA